ncbi:MAG TPA: response regulator [Zeimonas sp.]|nr:response regulator [Zeimonas sp.]
MSSRPVYRVAAAGLDPRDVRLIEIVFKHSQYNRFDFVFEPRLVPETVDILIVNPVEPEGLRAVARVRTLGRDLPVISAVPRGATSSARHAISIDRLTLQLLPILNRVVEMELLGADTRPMADPIGPGSTEAAGAPPAQAPQPSMQGPEVAGSAGPSMSHADLPTRDFLREAGRLSRQGDTERHAPTAEPEPTRLAEQLAQPWPPHGGEASSNLVPFPVDAESASPQIRVLVVDDSPTVRKQLSVAFARMRVDCDVAASAAEAMQRMAERHYDLALVDVVMPDIDGYKLTRQIRRMHRGTPVIILTSRSSPFDLARGALAGCNSYLVKPVPLKQLEAAVVKQLRRSLAIDDLRGLIRLSGEAPPRAAAARSPSPAGAGGAGERATRGARE